MDQNKVFQSTAQDKVRKSAFDLSHTKALSGVMGNLIPTLLTEVIPGDEFNIQQENFVRLAPMLAPVMHMIHITTHFFFVPNRIIWDEWEDFITGGQDGTSEPIMPTLALNQAVQSSGGHTDRILGDYLGLPTNSTSGGTNDLKISLLPFRAYQEIYNEFYRDQTLNDKVDITSNPSVLKIRKSSWQKDYFTSALPFLQRGEEIGVPIELEYSTDMRAVLSATGGKPAQGQVMLQDDLPNSYVVDSAGSEILIQNLESTNLDFTINELRTSSALQRFLEKQATGGYRYTETLRNHFNVVSSDARLQRPEYIGGGKNPVVITEVLSNAQTVDPADGTTVLNPVGEMAGHGASQGQTISANYKAEEHGFIMGITRVLPETMYFQGIPKFFLYDDKFDYAWPELANLGEQPILQNEIYFSPDNVGQNKAIFGYQQRYAQYKFAMSTVHGDFRNKLDYWHMARKFENVSEPVLNGEFVKANPTTRIFNVQDEDHLWIQILNKVKALRPLPYFANPQLR